MKYKTLILLCIFISIASSGLGKETIKEAENRVKKAVNIRKKAQIEQDKWIEEKNRLTQQYDLLVQEIKELEYQNQELKKQKLYLENSIDRLNRQIKKAQEISKGIMPYLKGIYKKLSEFIKLDLPFLKQEREKRLLVLNKILNDPSVSISEKYRRTMEALFIEEEYGRTVGVYREKINLNGEEITGDIFRLGRIAMFFKSPDGKKYAVYDVSKSKWIPLKSSIGTDIKIAIQIAQKTRPVKLLKLPVGKVENYHEK